jgi:RimJ/RimL family protein N-acetyltransferase
LDAEIPENWQPAGNYESTMKWFLDRLKENPANFGWLAWYIPLKNDDQNKRTAIGGIGFKGAPDENGVVETGYGIMEKFQLKGYASEALKGILLWAFQHPELKKVIAETDEENHASLGILQKNNFRFAGQGSEERTVRYEI